MARELLVINDCMLLRAQESHIIEAASLLYIFITISTLKGVIDNLIIEEYIVCCMCMILFHEFDIIMHDYMQQLYYIINIHNTTIYKKHNTIRYNTIQHDTTHTISHNMRCI